jgi:hypothetical protein
MMKLSQQKACLDVQRKPRTVDDHESQIGPSAPPFCQGGVTFPSPQQQLDAAVYALQVQHHYQQQVNAAPRNRQAQDDEIW